MNDFPSSDTISLEHNILLHLTQQQFQKECYFYLNEVFSTQITVVNSFKIDRNVTHSMIYGSAKA